MSKEMVIGLPIKVGEDIFIRDEEGNITGQKNTPIEIREEHAEELAKRKAYHDAKIHKEFLEGYRLKRADAYPEYGEFADMMYRKIEASLEAQEAVTTGELAWYKQCKAVKERFPKPTV